jgi:putative membrane protein
MRVIRIATFVTAAALAARWVGWDAAGLAQAAEQTSAVSAADEKFLEDAYNINESEILLGQLAQQNGMALAVQEYGRRMTSDHSEALAEEKQVAGEVLASLPSEVDAATRAQYKNLSTKRGRDFDLAYSNAMMSGHEEAVREFGDEAESGTSSAVRAYAQNELPMLLDHLRLARELAQSLRAGTAAP